MQTELRQFIEKTLFHRPVIRQVMELLPKDDAALDELLGEVATANNIKMFMFVMVAAAAAERRMDARHLAHGAMMFPEHRWMGKVVARMHGDIVEPLLTAIETTHMDKVCEAAALHLMVEWCEVHRGGVLPDKLIPLARASARKLKPNSRVEADLHVLAFLRALAARTKDAGLNALLRQRYPSISDEKWKFLEGQSKDFSVDVLAGYRESILEFVPDKPRNTLADGNTMRRAVARVGRNEPCPCGSGKKYKHCCIGKNQERLHHSSDVAGLTQEELYAQIEEHLTADRLNQAEPYEMARLNPVKIPAALLDTYFRRLSAFNLLDRAVEALEILGWSDKLKEGWEHVMFAATRAGRRDVGQRLMRLREPHGFTEASLDFSNRLLLAGEDPARSLQLIEENARKILQTEDMEELLGLAYGVTFSRFPALGILLYRGVFPLVPPDRALASFEQLLLARDRLNLPPDDPFSDILDKQIAEHEAGDAKDAEKLRAAQRSLEVKAQEVRELKDSLERLQKEIVRREQKRATQTPAAPAVKSPLVDDPALKELRRKVEELKSALNERHLERNDLRRELQKAHTDLEILRQNAASAVTGETEEPDREEELLLPQDAPEVHPVRLIEFPKNFQQTLAGFPRHVARAAVIMTGRLAAGEPAAFVGALRLKAVPNVMRQRIGSDYRLLFRLHPDHLQVIDLINRKDLDRRLKTLA
ncbi:MAG TPA: SEC-C metal-binding domain-containing protein [Candidatus Aquilonibacter sp.]|nr:SEC-C metal-binding domain-containing protein [Candidatus Aquilonibacter sp.]